MSYWWLSFADPDKPTGEKFLGALIIRAHDDVEMLKRSWMLELNPGGEVAFFEIPKQYEERIPPDWVETRLLTKKQCDELENKWLE